MKKRIIIGLGLLCAATLTLAGCSNNTSTSTAIIEKPSSVTEPSSEAPSTEAPTDVAELPKPDVEAKEYVVKDELKVKFTAYDLGASENANTKITFSDREVTIDGTGATVSGNKVIISSAGAYELSGTLNNGQVYINATDKSKVQLILNNVDLVCNFSAPIYCANADKLIITLAANSTNKVSDSVSGTDETAKGCIYSVSDLTFNGTGSLEATGNFNHCLSTKDDLKIVSGTYTLKASESAIRGKDSVSIVGGSITITGSNDGIKSNKKDDSTKGFILIDGCELSITADDDSLQATTGIVIRNSKVLARCFGDLTNCEGFVEGADSITRWN